MRRRKKLAANVDVRKLDDAAGQVLVAAVAFAKMTGPAIRWAKGSPGRMLVDAVEAMIAAGAPL